MSTFIPSTFFFSTFSNIHRLKTSKEVITRQSVFGHAIDSLVIMMNANWTREEYQFWRHEWKRMYKTVEAGIRLNKKYRKTSVLTHLGVANSAEIALVRASEARELRILARVLLQIRANSKVLSGVSYRKSLKKNDILG